MVKGVHFLGLRDAGDPVELGRFYSDEGADELVFLDITASYEKRKIIERMVREVAKNLQIPFTVGGGIRGIEDARLVLQSGADKVSINTAAVEKPSLITEIAETFGSQCTVVAIDAKRQYTSLEGKNLLEEGSRRFWFEVYTYGGRKPTGIDALDWAVKAMELGAGEFLVTSMDRDGTKLGYDIPLTRAISERVKVPVIASGGAGFPEHFLEAFTEGKADAALAASIFHYNEYPIRVVKDYLRGRGVRVRL